MGCASSAPLVDEHSTGVLRKQDPTISKEQVEVKSNSPTPQETAFALELMKLVNEATSSAKPKDSWVFLYKCADLICSAFGIKTCSIALYTSTGLSCKLACNTGSVLNDLVLQHPDLLPAETLGFITSATTSAKTVYVKAGDELWDTLFRASYADFQLLTGARGACTALIVLPLCGGPKCMGALVLGHTAQSASSVWQQSWLTTLVPMLSLYVSETSLVQKLSMIEKLVETASLSSLAYAVTTELGEIFEWCHREDVEARLVVLGQDADTATVYCKVPAATLVDDRTSMPSGLSSSLVRSGPVVLQEEGLVGTHMLLDNTLTKRCLSGRQRLLFVADVMQALKMYGEPWKDVFFDNAVVLTPSWVLAAPLMHEGKKLGAVLWLSSCRVNSDALMHTASTCASPIIHAIARATAMHQLYAAAGSGPVGGAVLGDSAYSKGTNGGGAFGGNSQQGVSSFTGLSSRQSSMLSRGRMQRLGTGPHEDALVGRGSTEQEVMMGDLDGGGSRPGLAVPDVPVKYMLRHSPSTSALMRMYKSTIAQRAPAVDEDRVTGSVHEIRILSKAGEGAFGSVYVGRWRNIVVAVKIIKDTSGTQSLKTAWELAVNKSLSHPSIVTVHAILTDVHLQKTSTRILRFVPSAAMEAQQAAAATSSSTSQPCFPQSPSTRFSNPGGGGGGTGNGCTTPRPGFGCTDGGGAAAAAVATAAVPALPLVAATLPATPSCPLPTKESAAGALGSLRGMGGGGSTGGGPEASGNSGNTPGVPPNFGRISAGSNAGAPSAALLKPSKPLAPKVHAILMEYCNLGGLHKYIDNRMFFKDRTLPEKGSEAARGAAHILPEALHMDFILATLSEIASALQYIHAQGFVHCDLKPENVLLKEANNRRGFTAKLADFGLSELRSADGQVVGDLGGTVTHVAPESVLHRQVSSASDMYAFGILMWELYTGQQPYRALLSHIAKREDRHRALLMRVVHEGLRPTFPPGVPQDYWSLAVQCWSPEPAGRPSTGEVLQILELMYSKYAGPSVQQAVAAPIGADPLTTPA